MNIGNILVVAVLIILGYVMYSYINSYNEIVNELKKIRLKCINGKNNKEKEEEEEEKKSDKNTLKTETEEEQKFEIIEVENKMLNKKIVNKNTLLLNTNGEGETTKSENLDEENDPSQEILQENVNFQKLGKKKNYSYNKNNYQNNPIDIDNKNISKKVTHLLSTETEGEYRPILESFENFQDQSKIDYWKPYVENINQVSQGFISCPYTGYNQELYEPLIIDSNTIKMRGIPGNNKTVNYNQVNIEEKIQDKNNNQWCLVDKVNKICVQQNNNQICKDKQTFDTQFQCQGYAALQHK